jgi:hypothetical protein
MEHGNRQDQQVAATLVEDAPTRTRRGCRPDDRGVAGQPNLWGWPTTTPPPGRRSRSHDIPRLVSAHRPEVQRALLDRLHV